MCGSRIFKPEIIGSDEFLPALRYWDLISYFYFQIKCMSFLLDLGRIRWNLLHVGLKGLTWLFFRCDQNDFWNLRMLPTRLSNRLCMNFLLCKKTSKCYQIYLIPLNKIFSNKSNIICIIIIVICLPLISKFHINSWFLDTLNGSMWVYSMPLLSSIRSNKWAWCMIKAVYSHLQKWQW